MGHVSKSKRNARAFAALLKADGPQDTAEPAASLKGFPECDDTCGYCNDEPARGDRNDFSSLDEMVAGLGKAGTS